MKGLKSSDNLKNKRAGLTRICPTGTILVIFKASFTGVAIAFQLSNKNENISPNDSFSGYCTVFHRSSVSPHEVRFRRCRKTTSMEGTVVMPRDEEKDYRQLIIRTHYTVGTKLPVEG